MSIKIYGSGGYSASYNGLLNVEPIKAEVYNNDSGEYYANVEIPIEYTYSSGLTLNYSTYFVQDNIVQLPTPWSGLQPFRLNNIEKSNNSLKCAKAYHVFRDLKNYALSEYEFITMQSWEEIGAYIMSQAGATDYILTFTASNSGQGGTFTMSDVNWNSLTAYDALVTLAKQMQAQLIIQGWNITIADKPVAVASDIILKNAKNIDDIKVTENWDNVCTRCIAIGVNNLRGSAVISNTYGRRYDKVIQCQPSSGVSKDNYIAIVNDLNAQASKYINDHKFPEINYVVNANPETTVSVGDPVTIQHTKLGTDITANILSVVYDSISKKYKKVEFGNYKPKADGLAISNQKQIDSLGLRLAKGGL